jgi:hypothetical protein
MQSGGKSGGSNIILDVSDWNWLTSRGPTASSLALAERVQDKLDATGYSQLLKDPVNVVSNGVFLYVESLGNLTVFHAVGD